jgi:hydroxypyruvate isomerase
MPKFAANLSMMFPELEPPARFRVARDAGFTAVEYLRPYAHKLEEMRGWLADASLELVLINSPAGNAEAGERGLAALPGREADFRESFNLALEYATGLGAGMVHVLAGTVPEGMPVAACEEVFIANIKGAADRAKARGVKLLLEPLNVRDAPGYLHTTTSHTRRLIEAIGSDNVFIQYDLYHMQIMQGDLVEGLRRQLDLVRHVQFSSLPGRNEPQYGEVNLPYVFEQIDAMGYEGWVGCEYRPKAGTLEGLSWANAYGLGGVRAQG